ncbi:MAG: cyclic nucleotide-binding domain-containing protein [Verrucomicrobia bacterium]|nr:cyclic nucleotide-binding domain-containing protein [Verrucomicrobiota bacterium]
MDFRTLGKTYRNGEVIIMQGESGDCMYVIQTGEVEVLQRHGSEEVRLAVLGPGDFFGEMALFQRELRSATVRAMGEARVLTVDKRTFMSRVHEDPSLAYRLVQTMSERLRRVNAEYVRAASSHPFQKSAAATPPPADAP